MRTDYSRKSCEWIQKIHSKHKVSVGIDYESLQTKENSDSYILSCPRFYLRAGLGFPLVLNVSSTLLTLTITISHVGIFCQRLLLQRQSPFLH